MVNQRVEAKKAKNYALADEIRRQIEEKGFVVKDSKDSYTISRK